MDAAGNIDDPREATSSHDDHRSSNGPSDDPIRRHHQAPTPSANSVVRAMLIMYVRCDMHRLAPRQTPALTANQASFGGSLRWSRLGLVRHARMQASFSPSLPAAIRVRSQ